jgi:hypothetical protein
MDRYFASFGITEVGAWNVRAGIDTIVDVAADTGYLLQPGMYLLKNNSTGGAAVTITGNLRPAGAGVFQAAAAQPLNQAICFVLSSVSNAGTQTRAVFTFLRCSVESTLSIRISAAGQFILSRLGDAP